MFLNNLKFIWQKYSVDRAKVFKAKYIMINGCDDCSNFWFAYFPTFFLRWHWIAVYFDLWFSEYWGSTQKRLSYCTAKKHTNKHSEIF